MVPDGVTRGVVRERDRTALLGAMPGEGFSLIVEVFAETGPRGHIGTWRLDIRRPRDTTDRQPWRIVAEEKLSIVEGLHRLSLLTDKQFAVRDLVDQLGGLLAAAAERRRFRGRDRGRRDRTRAARRRHDGLHAGAVGRAPAAETLCRQRNARDAVHYGVRPAQSVRVQRPAERQAVRGDDAGCRVCCGGRSSCSTKR